MSAIEGTRERIVGIATEYLCRHHDQDTSPAKAAKAAGVGLRSLQKAFRECLGTTPSVWLLQLRLRRARQALLAAEHGTSVASAAHDSGLHHLGRFAHHYRKEFGEAPSETLKASLKLRAAERTASPLAR